MRSRRVLGHSLVHSLAPLTDSLAPHCALRSRALLRCAYSLTRSAMLIRSLARAVTPISSSWESGFFSEMTALIFFSVNPLCDCVDFIQCQPIVYSGVEFGGDRGRRHFGTGDQIEERVERPRL